jgi:hypothetical protein
MADKISDPEFVFQLLEKMEGRPNRIKAERIAEKLGGRIRQRIMQYGKRPDLAISSDLPPNPAG